MGNRIFTRAGALAVVFFSVISFATAGPGPRIQAKELRYDFGKVKAGEPAEHLFEIMNSGDDVLVVQKLQPS